MSPCNGDIEENVSGTCSEPILVAIVPGKKGAGATFLIKIEELYYEKWRKAVVDFSLPITVTFPSVIFSMTLYKNLKKLKTKKLYENDRLCEKRTNFIFKFHLRNKIVIMFIKFNLGTIPTRC